MKLKCVDKRADTKGSTVTFATGVKEIATPQGPKQSAESVLILQTMDPATADGYLIGKEYTVNIVDA